MLLSHRLYVNHLTEAGFEELLAFLGEHREVVDEVSLFTEFWHHGYFPPVQFQKEADLLARRMERFRKSGVRNVGINVLDTTGHADEAWDFLAPPPFQRVVGNDGKESRSCVCANTPEFKEYIREKYRMVARAKPDHIWVDDDIRMKNKGLPFACFCPTCLALFARESGEKLRTREELVEAMNAPENGLVRRAWLDFNGRTIERLLREIRATVEAVDPKIELGLMTCSQSVEASLWQYSGIDIPRKLEALGATRVRPGGGFYDDDQPREMVTKALNIAEQVENLPPRIEHVLYELENFPYHKLGKSVRTLINECTLALVAGCNGVAFNALKETRGYRDYEELFPAIQEARPGWEALVKEGAPLAPAGIWCAYDKRILGHRELREGEPWLEWKSEYEVAKTYPWAQIGMPLTRERKNSSATLLHGRLAEAFTDAELRELLAGGVMMDVESLKVLWKRGLGPLTGVEPGKSFDNGVRESFTDHPLNGPHAHENRDARLSFWGGPAQALVPVAKGVESLTELIGYDFSKQGSALSLFENELGGRVAVMGYVPWWHIKSSPKRWQLLELADWVSRRKLPLRIDEALRITPFVKTGGGSLLAVLLNTSYDAATNVEVTLRGRYKGVEQMDRAGAWQPLKFAAGEDEVRATIPELKEWRIAILRATA